MDTDHYSEAQNVYIENRGGVGFGKLYIYREGHVPSQRGGDVQIEAVMLWTASSGLSDSGSITTTDEQRARAVHALCETEWGAAAIGMRQQEPEPPYVPKHLKQTTS